MAADRQSGDLAELLDPWQPALLALVAACGEAGRRAGKPVGVCGEAAADPLLAPVLVGLGITSLSMSARAVPAGRRGAGPAVRWPTARSWPDSRSRPTPPPRPGRPSATACRGDHVTGDRQRRTQREAAGAARQRMTRTPAMQAVDRRPEVADRVRQRDVQRRRHVLARCPRPARRPARTWPSSPRPRPGRRPPCSAPAPPAPRPRSASGGPARSGCAWGSTRRRAS